MTIDTIQSADPPHSIGRGPILHILLALVASILLASPVLATEVDLRITENSIRAIQLGRVLWTNTHGGPTPQSPARDEWARVDPVVVGERAYYSITRQLFEVDSKTGQIVSRHLLPGQVSAMRPIPGGVEVSVRSAGTNPGPGPDWERSYRFGQSTTPVPLYLLADPLSASLMQREAAAVVPRIFVERTGEKLDPDSGQLERPGARRAVRRGIEELGRLAAGNPTSPWPLFYQGHFLEMLGEDGMQHFEKTLRLDPAYDFELLILQRELQDYSLPFADEAFERGMASIVDRGYVPELNFDLSSAMDILGSYESRVPQPNPAAELRQLLRRGEQLWQLAPFADRAELLYLGLAEKLRDLDRRDEASLWETRARQSLEFRNTGFTQLNIDLMGLAITFLPSLLLAMAVLLLAFGLRDLHLGPERFGRTRWWHYLPTIGWSHRELLSILALVVAFVLCGSWLYRNAEAYSARFDAPKPLISGYLHHPDSTHFLDQITTESKPSRVQELATRMASEIESSLRGGGLRPLPSRAARRTSIREGDLPTPQDWKKLWISSVPPLRSLSDWSRFLDWHLFPFGGLAETIIGSLILLTPLLLLGLFLPGVGPRGSQPSRKDWQLWMLEILVPGFSKKSWGLGGLLLACILGSWLTWNLRSSTAQAPLHLLDSASSQAYSETLGLTGSVPASAVPWTRASARIIVRFWWMAWLAHGLWILVTDRFWPSQSSPFARGHLSRIEKPAAPAPGISPIPGPTSIPATKWPLATWGSTTWGRSARIGFAAVLVTCLATLLIHTQIAKRSQVQDLSSMLQAAHLELDELEVTRARLEAFKRALHPLNLGVFSIANGTEGPIVVERLAVTYLVSDNTFETGVLHSGEDRARWTIPPKQAIDLVLSDFSPPGRNGRPAFYSMLVLSNGSTYSYSGALSEVELGRFELTGEETKSTRGSPDFANQTP